MLAPSHFPAMPTSRPGETSRRINPMGKTKMGVTRAKPSSRRSHKSEWVSQVNLRNLQPKGGNQYCLKTARCGWIPKAALVSNPFFAAEAFKPQSTHRYFRTSGKETNLGSVQTRIIECPQSGHRTGSTRSEISLIPNMRTHLVASGSHL
jgi:hypothetical protein